MKIVGKQFGIKRAQAGCEGGSNVKPPAGEVRYGYGAAKQKT
jgi:hypothetical protein